MTSAGADELITDAREAMASYIAYGDMESAERVCQEYFGLEPNYLMELV